MLNEQREALDEIVVKMRAGRMRRRTFLERAMLLGLTSGATSGLLEACSSARRMIYWEDGGRDVSNVYVDLVKFFNERQEEIYVNYINATEDTGSRYRRIKEQFQQGKGLEIVSIDIIWVAEFAGREWIAPLDQWWPESDRRKYLPGPINGCTLNGRIWAAPLHTDVGLLYYRTDFLANLGKTPPETWEQMTDLAWQAQSRGMRYGYVWQGAAYEGLICNFLEVFWGYGGSLHDSRNAKKIALYNEKDKNDPALMALQQMLTWVDMSLPGTLTTYKEEDGRALWQQDYAAFMRHWPTAYLSAQDLTTSLIVGKFDVHPMLYGGSHTVGHSCIGGWQLAINAHSSQQQRDDAWRFIQYMIGPEAQRQVALNRTLAVTLKSVYDDPDVLGREDSFFTKIKPTLLNALPRPVSTQYATISDLMQKHIHAALTRQASHRDALSALQAKLQELDV